MEGWEGCGVCDVDFVICIQVVEVVLDYGDWKVVEELSISCPQGAGERRDE